MLLEMESEVPINKLLFFVSCLVMTGYRVKECLGDERNKKNNYIIRSEPGAINFQYLQIINLTFHLDQNYFSEISSKRTVAK
jgi:hypothetical protein